MRRFNSILFNFLHLGKFYGLYIFFALIAQEIYAKNSFEIEKCSRTNVGIINSQSNFNGNRSSLGFFFQNSFCLKPVKKIGTGIGSGFLKYSEQNFFPVYFDLMFCQTSRIFWNVEYGYAFGWENSNDYYADLKFIGGLFSQVGMGYKFKMPGDYKSGLYVAYNFQKASLEKDFEKDKYLRFNSVIISLIIILEKK